MDYHWIATLTYTTPSGLGTNTASGIVTITRAETQEMTFANISRLAAKQLELPDDAEVAVLYYRLVPNDIGET